ncbi:MAG: M18 family aminopeptidase [Gammaproteobacteria bacterium]|nr:M18 family aminopeptidase [Gammaproteobacteria bacterium]NNM11838.1 M18 family aminopeptidase [Pseudomonadales bacterium]RZV53301.1 MAG: M18 family aminopeptidase [Pseudomonadales bacterium]
MTKRATASKPGRKPVKSKPRREGAGLNEGLLKFIDASPTPFHAARSLAGLFSNGGFTELDEAASWQLKPGGKYFVLRNASSIIAWRQGHDSLPEAGWRMLGAHTDSPCLKIKPNPELREHDYYRLGVEVYGGALLNPWFDRDLSIAGRVHFAQGKTVASALVDFEKPVATLPSLAIHLDREANNSRSINAQQHLPVLLGGVNNIGDAEFRDLLKQQLQKQAGVEFGKTTEVLDYELSLYDTQPAALVGLHDEYIAAARLDNLLSCFIDASALIDACKGKAGGWSLLVCNDHEEVGSQSASGAGGPFLAQVLERVQPDSEARARAMANSLLISTDNAHGLHPNYADKTDANHAPKLNAGPVIKVNANQRYASNSETQAMFRAHCAAAKVPVQSFVVRSDMACGSTIGPITASELGVRTLDIGVPTFAMHSIRELAGGADTAHLYAALSAFYKRDA